MTIRDAIAIAREVPACADAIEWFEAAVAGTPCKFRFEADWLGWAEIYHCLPETFRPAMAAYQAIVDSAWATYKSIVYPTWATYWSIVDSTWATYKSIVDPARAAYRAIVDPARAVLEAEIRRLCTEESK